MEVDGESARRSSVQTISAGSLEMATGATFQNIFFPFNNPTQISGCQLWLDGADAATVTGTSSVTAWTDKSGKENNPTFSGTNPS